MIGLIGFVTYVLIGSVACYFIKVNSGTCFREGYEDYSTAVAIISGVCWPLVAPFALAILFAKRKGEKE